MPAPAELTPLAFGSPTAPENMPLWKRILKALFAPALPQDIRPSRGPRIVGTCPRCGQERAVFRWRDDQMLCQRCIDLEISR